ncbi:hypothetical protein [Campylobacter upsaliensis]|uniref:hypothetical protein n=1 Tax=Campylobacter upsaliensis TaxID=28080 RepID=UPI0022EAC200|nr:hypothetical protein [Campylobacter upsaliensis]
MSGKCYENFALKKEKMIMSARLDGFGERMLSLLNAMFISYKTGLKFGYVWHNFTYSDLAVNADKEKFKDIIIHPQMCAEWEIFEENFIRKYSYTQIMKNFRSVDGLGLFLRHKKYYLKNVVQSEPPYDFGYISTQYDLSQICYDVDQKEYYDKIKQIWETEIIFTDKIQRIRSYAQNYVNFVAFHIRSGDVIYTDRSYFIYEGQRKALSFHLALWKIEQEIEKHNIIVFADDIISLEKLKEYFESYRGGALKDKFMLAKNLSDQFGFFGFENTFFEVELMSKANKIYSSGKSGFSNLASMISGESKVISLYKDLTDEQQMNAIEQSLHKIKLLPLQEAFSYMHLYILSENLGYSIEMQQNYLAKAMELDETNYAFQILYLDTLLKDGKVMQSEEYLKQKFDVNRDDFIRYLFEISPYDYSFIYSFVLCKLLKNAHIVYPCINLVIYMLIDRMIRDCKLNIRFKDNVEEEESKKYLSYFIEHMNVLYAKRTIAGAPVRVRNHLSFKLGKILLSFKNPFGLVSMPFFILWTCIGHGIAIKNYRSMCRINPELSLPSLENYVDYNEAMKIKNYLTYRLGNAFVKHPFTFMFKINKIYKEWKEEKTKDGNRI